MLVDIVMNNINVFWEEKKNGSITVLPMGLKLYLEHNGYYKYYPVDGSKSFIFVKKQGNFVDVVSEFEIKDFVLTELEGVNTVAYNVTASNTRLFSSQFLSILKTVNIDMACDALHYSYFYYTNTVVKVSKDNRQLISYSELDSHVWSKQVIQREYTTCDHHDSEFRTFVWFASGENVDRYNSLKSVIGYLLHTHKNSASNRAIIFNDESISDNPEGGTGKSLFCTALTHMRNVSTIDGKNFDFDKNFAYQSVKADSQLLVFDDVKKNFNFENLFPLITQGIEIEYKGKDKITIPISKSPKIIITTNYSIGGIGNSFERRKFEVEISAYFNKDRTPLDVFKHMLFDEWDLNEWSRFDNFMMNCLEFYLQNGLVQVQHSNLELKKLINQTSQDFIEFIEDSDFLKNGERINKTLAFADFIEQNKDFKNLKRKTFIKWIVTYCNHYKLDYNEGNTNGSRWFQIGKEKVAPF